MTKKELAIIKEHEARAWTELQRYRYFNGSRDTNPRTRAEWEHTDSGYRERLSIWCEVNSVLLELGIASDFNEDAMEYMTRYCHEITMIELAGIYHDTESGEILTADDLYTEYLEAFKRGEVNGVTFKQHVNNCLTRNGGTLERI